MRTACVRSDGRRVKMRKSQITTIGGAAFAIAFAGAVIAVPANATVIPNGSFDFSSACGQQRKHRRYSEHDDLAFA